MTTDAQKCLEAVNKWIELREADNPTFYGFAEELFEHREVLRAALLEHDKMREACNGAREALENCTPPRSGLSGILYSYGHYSHKKINRKEMEMAEKALASLDAALKEGE